MDDGGALLGVGVDRARNGFAALPDSRFHFADFCNRIIVQIVIISTSVCPCRAVRSESKPAFRHMPLRGSRIPIGHSPAEEEPLEIIQALRAAQGGVATRE